MQLNTTQTNEYTAAEFWERYQHLTDKDLPVIAQTNIKQSTLSTWRTGQTFPRADQAVKIAEVRHTSVEFLVSGRECVHSTCSPQALRIALAADSLSDEGKRIALSVVRGLEKRSTRRKVSACTNG